MKYYLTVRKNEIMQNAICRNVDGTERYYSK